MVATQWFGSRVLMPSAVLVFLSGLGLTWMVADFGELWIVLSLVAFAASAVTKGVNPDEDEEDPDTQPQPQPPPPSSPLHTGPVGLCGLQSDDHGDVFHCASALAPKLRCVTPEPPGARPTLAAIGRPQSGVRVRRQLRAAIRISIRRSA